MAGHCTRIEITVHQDGSVTVSDINSVERAVEREMLQEIVELKRGLAVVAMIAGVSYAEAKPAVKSRPNRSGNATTYADLRWGLDSYGIGYEMNGRPLTVNEARERTPRPGGGGGGRSGGGGGRAQQPAA